jgi:N-acetylmuramoyl-L-alanine amidase CwlA
MPYIWIGATHYTPGRGGNTIQGIVIHWMATTLAGADATFTDNSPTARQASAHYGVEGSTVHVYVDDNDTAWAVGDWDANQRTISVEVSAQPGRDATPETLATVISLITDLCTDHNLTADAIHQHNDYFNTQCPGTVPVATIREAVRAKLNNPKDTDMITEAEFERIFASVNGAATTIIKDNRAQLSAVAKLINPDIDETKLAAALLAQGTVTIAPRA